MKINVQTRDFTLTPALALAVENAAQGVGAQLRRPASNIHVRLFDVNGRKGGIDKVCQVTARSGRLSRVWIVSELDTDLYRAIGSAFDKLRRMVLATGHRERSLRRRRYGAVSLKAAAREARRENEETAITSGGYDDAR